MVIGSLRSRNDTYYKYNYRVFGHVNVESALSAAVTTAWIGAGVECARDDSWRPARAADDRRAYTVLVYVPG